MSTVPKSGFSSPVVQTVSLVSLYVCIFASTFWWSSVHTHATIYDKMLVRFEGISFPVRDLGHAAEFYTDVLNFEPITAPKREPEKKLQIGFLLPDQRKIFLEHSAGAPTAQSGIQLPSPDAAGANAEVGEHTGPLLVLRVRDGFENLHREITERYTIWAATHPVEARATIPGTDTARQGVSAIHVEPWGDEFLVIDPDGNGCVFLSPKRPSATRL